MPLLVGIVPGEKNKTLVGDLLAQHENCLPYPVGGVEGHSVGGVPGGPGGGQTASLGDSQ